MYLRDTNELDAAKAKFEEVLQLRINELGADHYHTIHLSTCSDIMCVYIGDVHHLIAAALIELGQISRLKGNFTAG